MEQNQEHKQEHKQDIQETTIRLPRKVHETLRLKAFKQRKSLNTVMVEAVEKGISDDEPKEKTPKTK